MVWKAEDRLIASTASHLSTGKASIALTCWMPALLTRMSIGAEHKRRFDHAGDFRRARHAGARMDRRAALQAPQVRERAAHRLGLAEAVYHDRDAAGDAPAGRRIIKIASAHALVASPFKSACVAAKHGIVGLTKVVALETAEDNITSNGICPVRASRAPNPS